MKKTFASLFLLAAVLLAACSGTATSTPNIEPVSQAAPPAAITAEGTLFPHRTAELAFAQGGVVKEILILPGERVAKGDVIARLIGIESAQAELAAAQLEQTLAQQALNSIRRTALLTSSQTEQTLIDAQQNYESEANGWNPGSKEEATDLELSIEDYVQAESDYRDARLKLDEALHLDPDDREREDAQQDFDTEKASLEQAYADLKSELAKNEKSLDEELIRLLSAISSLESARELQTRLDDSNLDPEILAAAEERLAAAKTHAAAAEAAIAYYELRAPFDGILLNTDLTVGEAALPMVSVAFVADTSHWIVKTKDLAEVDAALVSVGDRAVVQFDAFPGDVFPGTVTAINPVGRLYLGDMTYQATVTLDESNEHFLWNMTAVVTLETASP